jgi:hypothetical protein
MAPVITWLASYPRSGNTLLRVILNRCFGLFSQSIYDDNEFSDPAVRALVGHEAVGTDPRKFLAQAQKASRRLYVKTHEQPGPDRHPAIYVVRDGRAAIVSHMHFLNDILGQKISLEDVIRGKTGLSWSDHVRAWALSDRSDTLVLRFEDLIAADPVSLRAISRFVAQPLAREFDISFSHLHDRAPQFFRVGSNAVNMGEMRGDNLALFEEIHGETLRDMGYG